MTPGEDDAFTAADLALLDGEVAPDTDEANAEDFDAELDARDEEMIRLGVFTREQLASYRGVSVEKVGKPRGPSLGQIEDELARISQKRRADLRGYFRDEAMQARELELLEAREKLKSGKRSPAAKDDESAPAEIASASNTDLGKVEAELRQIAKLRREDRRAYNRDEALQARERELLTRQAELKEAEGIRERAQGVADIVLASVDDPDAFANGFDYLPSEARTAIAYELAAEPYDPARPAKQADIDRFASTPEGAELVKEWGRHAGKKVAVVSGRIERMLSQGTDMNTAAAWLDGLSSAEAKAIWRALAG
jgi:hypothetical protein